MEDRPRRVVAVHQAAVQAGVAQGAHRVHEARALLAEVPVAHHVGGGEVGEGARTLDATMEVDHAAELHRVLRHHADAAHAGVYRQVVLADLVQRHGTLAVGEHEVHVVHRGHDVMLEKHVNALERRLVEHEDGPLDASLPKLDALVHRGHGELARARGVHGAGALDRPMPIGVRLHGAHHLDARAQERLEGPRVLAHGVEVDLHPGRARLWFPAHCHLRDSF